MNRIAQLLPWLCFLSLAGPVALRAETPATGVSIETPAGWERIQFVGNVTFTDEQLRSALLGEPDFLVAAHPAGPDTALGQQIESLLIKGYRNAGFPNVTVETAGTPQSLVCTIKEGHRFHCGKVRVQGAQRIDPEKLASRLTRPYPGTDAYPSYHNTNGKNVIGWVDKDGKPTELEDPVWKSGSPVRFDSERGLQKHLRAALSDLGYSAAIALTRIETDEQSQTASLVIDVINESDADRARQIVCEGLKVHSRDQLLRYLELAEGDPVNREQIGQWNQRLWECGRFTTHRLWYEPKTGELSIEVQEAVNVPALDEPLSENAKTFLAARRWLSLADSRGEDTEYVLKANRYVLRTIMSRQGWFVEVSLDRTGHNESPSTLTLMVDKDGLILDHSDQPGILHVDTTRLNGKVTLANGLQAATESKALFTLRFRFNASSSRQEHEAPIEHVLEISPADWLPLAYDDGIVTEVIGSDLVVRSEGDEIAMDRETGEISRLKLKDDSHLRFESGLFAAERAKRRSRLASRPNLYDPQHAVTSIASYLLSPPVVSMGGETSAEHAEKINAARKLVNSGVFSLPDSFISEVLTRTKSDRFVIPSDPPAAQSLQRALRSLAAKSVLKLAPQCFTEDEWPFQITRETCLLIMGRGQYTGKVLPAMLADEDNGPLCHAIVARLLATIGHPGASRFATRALETLNAEDFSRDYQKLARIPGNQQVVHTLLAIQSLSENELDALLELWDQPTLRRVIKVVHAARLEDSEEPGLIWYQISEAGLRSSMEKIR